MLMALSLPEVLEFQELLDAVRLPQSFKDASLLEIFTEVFISGNLVSYHEFIKTHPTFMKDHGNLNFSLKKDCGKKFVFTKSVFFLSLL